VSGCFRLGRANQLIWKVPEVDRRWHQLEYMTVQRDTTATSQYMRKQTLKENRLSRRRVRGSPGVMDSTGHFEKVRKEWRRFVNATNDTISELEIQV